MLARSLASLIMALFLCSCDQPSLPPGTIASVNGEPISLRSVQALLDSRSAALGIPPRPSVGEMQQNYRHTLGILIAHTLVRQNLAEHGLEVSERQLDEAVNQVRADFGDEEFSDYLASASLREEEWRLLVRDHLALQVFAERILLPSIKIPLSEIRSYYDEHEAEFALPESVLVCHAASEKREAVDIWCSNLAHAAFEPGPLAQCVEIAVNDVPTPWQADLKKIKPRECGQIVEQEGQWRALGLLQKNSPKKLPLSEVYGLIENILLEQKKAAAFEKWLEQEMAKAAILAKPELFQPRKTDMPDQ